MNTVYMSKQNDNDAVRVGRPSHSDKPAWTHYFKHLRERNGYRSQDVFAKAMRLDRGKIARIEAGYDTPKEGLDYEERVRMLRLFKVSHEAWIRESKIPLFDSDVPPPPDLIEGGTNMIVFSESRLDKRKIDFYANGSEPIDGDSYTEVQERDKNNMLPNTKIGLMVGDSMLDPSNPYAEWSLRDGDEIWANNDKKTLREGVLMALKLGSGGSTVKVVRQLDGVWWCFSYNEQAGHKPFKLPEDHEVLGEVYFKVPAGMRVTPKR